MSRARTIIAMLIALLLLAGAAAAGAEVYVNKEKPEDWEERPILRITALSFTQNDAFVLECGGHVMILDGGSVLRARDLKYYLQKNGLGHVDIIFNSHPHDDHIEAVYSAIRSDVLTADVFVSPFPADYKVTDDLQRKMVKLLEEKGIPFRQMLPGEELPLGDAWMELYRAEKGDANAMSGVLRIHFGDATILMTGDISGEAQKNILAQVGAEKLKSDILKCPHHGVKRMVPAFLEAVDPQFAIITSRKDTEAKQQLDYRKIPNLWTSLGDAVLETDGTDWYITQENKWK